VLFRSRGKPMSANSLVHIQNHGDFQIEKIVVHDISNNARSMAVDDASILPDSRQESLVSANQPDDMEGEQTWPTEEELADAKNRVEKMKGKRVKVPKGTSAYQAAWIVESDDEVDEDEDMEMGEEGEEEEHEFINLDDDNASNADGLVEELDLEEEGRQYQEYLSTKKREKDARDEVEFPDEIDTPIDVPASVRFQRFRGLKSFRTSPWDAYENLPVDYSRIFQFQNFGRTRRNVFKNLETIDEDPSTASPGTYITIHISSVPVKAFTDFSASASRPKILFTLLQHEQKMCVLNFSVTRQSVNLLAENLATAAAKDQDMASILESSNAKSVKDDASISIKLSEFTIPTEYIVKSKDPLLMCVGFRRYVVRPIYSTTTRGGSNNVHKFERFLQPGKASVGSVYAPIQFAPAPVTLFKEVEGRLPILVGSGSVLNNDPTRILAKRIVLTGHPFKVHKRTATIRYMFHSPEDVHYFKPVELSTKYGRKGHIRDSLGTHGYMKCMFDTQITQQDTICMYLYKRVFPKWNTVLYDQGGEGMHGVVELDKMRF